MGCSKRFARQQHYARLSFRYANQIGATFTEKESSYEDHTHHFTPEEILNKKYGFVMTELMGNTTHVKPISKIARGNVLDCATHELYRNVLVVFIKNCSAAKALFVRYDLENIHVNVDKFEHRFFVEEKFIRKLPNRPHTYEYKNGGVRYLFDLPWTYHYRGIVNF